MVTYAICTLIVIAVALLLNFIKLPTSEKSKSNEVDSTFNLDATHKREFRKMLQEMSADGTEEDEMPEGYGEFGLEVTNPIPTASFKGGTAYMERLRLEDGTKIEYVRTGSMKAPNISKSIDCYSIIVDGEEITQIYLCVYNKKNSKKVPKGFALFKKQ